MDENNLPDAEKLLAGIPRKPCASSDPLAEIERLTKLLSERNTECGKWFKECESLRAEVGRLTKERDAALGAADDNYKRWSIALGRSNTWREAAEQAAAIVKSTEKSRDEALAELNKALETLGQLRSDLQHSEKRLSWCDRRSAVLFDVLTELEGRNAIESDLKRLGNLLHDSRSEFMRRTNAALARMWEAESRAEDAEASLAKLREALRKIEIETGATFSPTMADRVIGDIHSIAHRALRSLLDEPGKDQNNAKR